MGREVVIGGLLVLVHIDGWVVVGLRARKKIDREMGWERDWQSCAKTTTIITNHQPASQPVQPAA